jgi:hypothetical protein
MNAPDALLIRNAAAERIGEQRLTIERLVEQHPIAFDGPAVDKKKRNRLDQRLRRLRTSTDPEALRRKKPALVDLLLRPKSEV